MPCLQAGPHHPAERCTDPDLQAPAATEAKLSVAQHVAMGVGFAALGTCVVGVAATVYVGEAAVRMLPRPRLPSLKFW